MEHTSSYQLCQWAEEDRILREDFNADNAKTEQGILSRLGPVEQIDQVSVSGNQGSVSIDMTGFDWSKWSFLALELRCSFNGYNAGNHLSVQVGGITSYERCSQQPPPYAMLAVFFPGRTPGRAVQGVVFPSGKLVSGTETYQSVTSLGFQVTTPTVFASGTVLTLYGVR